MTEYIEKDAAKKALGDAHFKNYGNAIAVIMELPTADVVERRQGQNICDEVNGHCEFKCSVCGVELSSVYGRENDFGMDGGYFNFCPNCGARMEES